MNSEIVAYAMDFASFLLQKAPDRGSIKNVILFGSVARGEAEKTSDVDIFVDVAKNSAFDETARNAAKAFMASAKCKSYWKPLGVENEINVTSGELSEWKELEPSIIADGIVLYGKFKPEVKGGAHRAFFIWENIKPNSQRVALNKKLFGHRQGKRFYSGLLQKYSGKRAGKGCIDVPLESAVIFQSLFRKYSVKVQIRKVVEY